MAEEGAEATPQPEAQPEAKPEAQPEAPPLKLDLNGTYSHLRNEQLEEYFSKVGEAKLTALAPAKLD